MIKFLKPCVYETSGPTVAIDPKKVTFGQLTFQAGDRMIAFVIPRADLERLRHEIDEAIKSAPLPAQKRKVGPSAISRNK
jgi:hypothetical protein